MSLSKEQAWRFLFARAQQAMEPGNYDDLLALCDALVALSAGLNLSEEEVAGPVKMARAIRTIDAQQIEFDALVLSLPSRPEVKGTIPRAPRPDVDDTAPGQKRYSID